MQNRLPKPLCHSPPHAGRGGGSAAGRGGDALKAARANLAALLAQQEARDAAPFAMHHAFFFLSMHIYLIRLYLFN